MSPLIDHINTILWEHSTTVAWPSIVCVCHAWLTIYHEAILHTYHSILQMFINIPTMLIGITPIRGGYVKPDYAICLHREANIMIGLSPFAFGLLYSVTFFYPIHKNTSVTELPLTGLIKHLQIQRVSTAIKRSNY